MDESCLCCCCVLQFSTCTLAPIFKGAGISHTCDGSGFDSISMFRLSSIYGRHLDGNCVNRNIEQFGMEPHC